MISTHRTVELPLRMSFSKRLDPSGNLPGINSRIKHLIEEMEKGNVAAFSRKIEVSQPRIARLFALDSRGGSSKYPLPSRDIVTRIIDKYGVNIEWLEFGTGEMYSSKPKPASELIPLFSWEDIEEIDPTYLNKRGTEFKDLGNGRYLMSVPLVTQYVYGGFVAGWADPEYLEELPKHHIVVNKIHQGHYLAYEVRGDSMDFDGRDSIAAGNIVTGRRIDRQYWNYKFHLSKYPYYIIVTNDGMVVKQITEHDIENNYITCHSLNPDKDAYPDYRIYLNQVNEIYNVVRVERVF